MRSEGQKLNFTGRERVYALAALVVMAAATLNWAFVGATLGPLEAKAMFAIAVFHGVLVATYLQDRARFMRHHCEERSDEAV